MKKNNILNKDVEKIVRNILIVLTIISLALTILDYTYVIYNEIEYDYTRLNDFIVKCTSGIKIWVLFILQITFAIAYIKAAIKYKKETVIKVAFSIFSIITNIITLNFITNIIAGIFNII